MNAYNNYVYTYENVVASRAAAVKDQQRVSVLSQLNDPTRLSVCGVSVGSSSLLLLTLNCHSESSVNFYFIINCLKCLFLIHS